MATITGVVAAKTVVTVTAASGGDATTIAAAFNGLSFPSIATGAATAAAVGSVATITWPSQNMLADDDLARTFVATKLAAILTLTSPISISAITQSSLV